MADTPTDRMMRAINKLAKWRTVLAGWHLGSRAIGEPGVQAMRDLREAVLIHRVELNALSALLIAKGVFTADEHADAMGREAVQMDGDMASRFPGYRSIPEGLTIYDAELVQETHRRLGFPA